ncbi:MAG: hypothetical protein V1838_01770 [Patescibacteria group bacterium]
MFRLHKAILAKSYYWFGVVMALFGVVTEISGQQIYLSSYFYLELAIVAFLAGIFAQRDE